ncbi:hypothetical protein QQ056_14540 [Oscillatoria laete-virens NRMC-F 0139]|nr:hypothetical protein [Oscillatoria laete-virens]MDL5054755.1 hypothetical protein [Oscillatoria laete-virens NRMC-F 0139]
MPVPYFQAVRPWNLIGPEEIDIDSLIEKSNLSSPTVSATPAGVGTQAI